MNILITGSNGTVGGVLKKGLPYLLNFMDLPADDCRDYETVLNKMDGQDVVIHLAWDLKTENYNTDDVNYDNLRCAYNVYKAAVRSKVKRIIMVSSVHASKFDDRQLGSPLINPFDLSIPDSPYGASKGYTESLGRYFASKYDIEVICIRLGGVSKNGKPPIGPTTERQVWLSHNDLINAFKAAIDADKIPYNYTIFYAVSNNEGRLHDTVNPFSWEPKDRASLEPVINYKPITELPVPSIEIEQLDKFNRASIHTEKISDFEPASALEALKSKEGSRVIGADFGGDKGLTKLFVIKNGKLVLDDEYSDHVQSTGGEGYLESLEKTANFANKYNIPVGISWGAPLDGNKPLFHPKAEQFLQALSEKYDGDFKNLVPTLTSCLNDGPAGLISGVIEASRTKPVESLLFVINGGGLGLAALSNGQIFSTEAGHVEALSKFNVYKQTLPCGVYGATYICLEKLGANKSGIETQWEIRNKEYMRARDIEDQFKQGDQFAGELYDHSAMIVAHMIIGGAKALDIDLNSSLTAIVGHGGAFKFPDYGDRVQQIIAKYTGVRPELLMTHKYSDKETNACLDGAALAAVINF